MNSSAIDSSIRDFQLAQSVGLTENEWNWLCQRLQRYPTEEELQMIGVMWSEHCSYKSSKHFLKKLKMDGPAVLQGPGENAGLVDFDEERALAFKIESHNHPSFVEPFQGAATGVGGILRDIFTMGARPIALGNFLRFGPLALAKHRHLMRGVVEGISHYGNCVGVPMLLGQLHTDGCYEHNILVNVFALGILSNKNIFKSNTAIPGHSVMIWGARTGRDGIHGASLLASAQFDSSTQKDLEQKIRVQVGDPFKEKCLMEACLESMEKFPEDLLCIQDMGAAGLTCSTMEISDKSKVGMKIDLNRVPTREAQMKAYELLLSESQERMLAVVRKGTEEKFREVLKRWQCEAEVIGETTDDGRLRMSFDGKEVVNLPVQDIIDPPPAELPPPEEPSSLFKKLESLPPDVGDELSVLKEILSLPRIASKAALYESYDSTVGAATRFGPGHEAGVLWLGSKSNPYLGAAVKAAADEALAKSFPRFAASYSLAECVRALACVGARALAYTDGINMGVPQHSSVQWALSETVSGLNEAAEVFETPCISGNVSLYNQTKIGGEEIDIDPTVFVVSVGKIKDVRLSKPSFFRHKGNEVWLLEVPGNPQTFPHSSVYAREILKLENSETPFLDLVAEKRLQEALLEAHKQDLFASVRDISDGGLAVSLAEACFQNNLGLDADLSKSQQRRDFQLFHEGSGRVIVEIEASRRAALMKLSMKWNLEVRRVGQLVEEDVFRIRPLLSARLSELKSVWTRAILK